MFASKFCKIAPYVGVNKLTCSFTRPFSVSSTRHGEMVGFVGLGNMGAHMARNLLKHNHKVLVYDLSSEAVKSVTDKGAESASSPAEVANETSTIVTMLPSSPHVKEVYTGANGILSKVRSGSLLLDSSTIDPMVSQQMETAALEKGATYMDAPVSGGVVAARDALLTFMVGGPTERFEEASAILSNMGKNVVHCGKVGTGQASKICNNMLLGISMIGAAETMNLGINLGLDPKLLAKILNMSSGRCWSTELYNPCPGVVEGIPASNNYQGGFGVPLMAKDLGLAKNAAAETRTATAMGSMAHQIYTIMTTTDYKGLDFASVFKFLQDVQEIQKKQ